MATKQNRISQLAFIFDMSINTYRALEKFHYPDEEVRRASVLFMALLWSKFTAVEKKWAQETYGTLAIRLITDFINESQDPKDAH